ncbi:hypothetical protein AC623_14000 [Bacillus sp. FJAT-27231]|uniref:prepilin-type N-terminal cleavage/methylation domain-containing protein n=1 Tax=Bacillus sp. FJAT-27231 TaxID=1679168 RepID=UPI00069EE87B|nr:prepilin-type N-terminal cleavage/methylation domain-containing protein [Bacillus sp. FJAT-27231]KMY54909.1 hypothetical protein AC623_14000 [Bacillus sp. FJAT-27231]
MIATIKQRLKDQKGLTLIELLAVVVILAIISAIAIPAIGGLIDNTKKDAHVANAQQMISSAKTWVAGNANEAIDATNGQKLTLQKMMDDGLIDPIDDPDKGTYDATASYVLIKKSGKTYSYEVKLTNGTRGIWVDEPKKLKRANVTEPVSRVATAATT